MQFACKLLESLRGMGLKNNKKEKEVWEWRRKPLFMKAI